MEKNNLVQPPPAFSTRKKLKFFGCYHSVFCRVDICSCEISSLGQCQLQSKGSSEPCLTCAQVGTGWGGSTHLWPHRWVCPVSTQILKTSVLSNPYPVPRAFQKQTHPQGSHTDTAVGSTTGAAGNLRSSV